MYRYLSQLGFVLHDVLVGGEESVEPQLSDLEEQATSHRRGALCVCVYVWGVCVCVCVCVWGEGVRGGGGKMPIWTVVVGSIITSPCRQS